MHLALGDFFLSGIFHVLLHIIDAYTKEVLTSFHAYIFPSSQLVYQNVSSEQLEALSCRPLDDLLVVMDFQFECLQIVVLIIVVKDFQLVDDF